jgi:hypothetical protein
MMVYGEERRRGRALAEPSISRRPSDTRQGPGLRKLTLLPISCFDRANLSSPAHSSTVSSTTTLGTTEAEASLRWPGGLQVTSLVGLKTSTSLIKRATTKDLRWPGKYPLALTGTYSSTVVQYCFPSVAAQTSATLRVLFELSVRSRSIVVPLSEPVFLKFCIYISVSLIFGALFI